MITAYLYNSCTSCRKARALLDDAGVAYADRQFFKQKVTREELDEILASTGITIADILSTRSTPYKNGNLAEKNLTDDQLLDMMVEEPRLLKRPLLISGSTVVVGYNEEQILALIAGETES